MHMKLWLIIAIVLIAIGCVILASNMTLLDWDFSKLSTVKYETTEHRIIGEYTNISVIIDTADIAFVVSENADTTVVCCEQENMKHTVATVDGTLRITVEDTSKWYEHIGINFGSPTITIHIPQGEYGSLSIQSSTGDVNIPKDFSFETVDILESTGDVTSRASVSGAVKIRTSTGDIAIEHINADSLTLAVSTGKVTVSDTNCEGDISVTVSTGKVNLNGIRCRNVMSTGNTGDVSLQDVIATEQFSIQRSTGDVKLNGCDAGEIYIETDTGRVSGSILSDKVFITETDTGSVHVPKTTNGGRCEITTSTGDIKITVIG